MRRMFLGQEVLKNREIPGAMSLLPTQDIRKEHTSPRLLEEVFVMALAKQKLIPGAVRLLQMADKVLPPSLPERGAMDPWSTQGTVCPLQEQRLHQVFLGFRRWAKESPLDLELTPQEQIQPYRGMDP